MRSSDTRAETGAARRTTPLLALALAAGALSAGPLWGQPSATGPSEAGGSSAVPSAFPAVAAEELRERGWSVRPGQADRVTVERDGLGMVLQLGNPFARLDEGVVQLANAPYREGDRLWLPKEALELVGGAGEGGRGLTADRHTPWKVVLDPGHGGRDPGARGPRGTREKDVVLAIARRVADELRSEPGIEPVLTREGDSFVPLAERSRTAVKEGADLFVSIHANAARDRRAAGFETYLLGEARTEWARQVAMRENSVVKYEDGNGGSATDAVQVILANMDLNLYREESNFLAGTIQNALRERVPAPDRGVKQNIYLVLANAGGSMPAVLVEAGFVSNPEGERRLRSEAGQAAIAEAVAEAVVRYFRERERRQGVFTAAR